MAAFRSSMLLRAAADGEAISRADGTPERVSFAETGDCFGWAAPAPLDAVAPSQTK